MNDIGIIVYCSHCGTPYTVYGDYSKRNSACCNKPLVRDERAVWVNISKIEIRANKLILKDEK